MAHCHPLINGRTVILISDAEYLKKLLAQCALGNRRAFETLYRSVAPRLQHVALQCISQRDLAEHVVQESFVRIWHNAAQYDPHLSAPVAWMIAITHDQAIEQLRTHRELPEGALQQPPCLEQLDGMQRQTITTAYFHGRSAKELAEQLAAPLGSVKVWLRRGMERLRGGLEA